jgi:hypothetical protein
MDRYVPNYDHVGEASNGVPAPLLRAGVVLAESSEETSQNHDDIGDNGHEGMGAIDASKQAKVEEQQGRGDAPVNITTIVHLAANHALLVFLLAVRIDAVLGNSLTSGHGKVRERGGDDNHRRDDVVQATRDRHVPRHDSEDARRCEHNHKHDPERAKARVTGNLVLDGNRYCVSESQSSH